MSATKNPHRDCMRCRGSGLDVAETMFGSGGITRCDHTPPPKEAALQARIDVLAGALLANRWSPVEFPDRMCWCGGTDEHDANCELARAALQCTEAAP